jgi:hypothetical protein
VPSLWHVPLQQSVSAEQPVPEEPHVGVLPLLLPVSHVVPVESHPAGQQSLPQRSGASEGQPFDTYVALQSLAQRPSLAPPTQQSRASGQQSTPSEQRYSVLGSGQAPPTSTMNLSEGTEADGGPLFQRSLIVDVTLPLPVAFEHATTARAASAAVGVIVRIGIGHPPSELARH